MQNKRDYDPVINFRSGDKKIELPEWFLFPDDGISMICGVGDYVHGQSTNVEQFKEYDIFVCYGDDTIPKSKFSFFRKKNKHEVYTSVEENVKWLKTHPDGRNKLLCLIDMTDSNQVDKFINIFHGKVKLLNSQTNSPIFNPLECVSLLKQPDGIVILHDITFNQPLKDIVFSAERTKWGYFISTYNYNKKNGYNIFGEITDSKKGVLECVENGEWMDPMTKKMSNAYLVCKRNSNAFEYQVGGRKKRTRKNMKVSISSKNKFDKNKSLKK